MKNAPRLITIGALLLSLLYAGFSGLERGRHHAARDYPLMSKEYLTTDRDYYLGTGTWNQDWPWTSDYIHARIHFQVIFLATAGAFFGLGYRMFDYKIRLHWMLHWALLVGWAIAIWYVEGQGFKLMYHVLLPNDPSVPQYDFWTWVVGLVKFW